MDEELLDFTKLKYVLYARKSTDDPERQVRSIDDQIDECLILAKRLNLNVADIPIIIEKKSAKKPGTRPLFTQMLKDIRQGKFDAILAWNPDRLARNMKEGGEVIDMIDDGYLKDLRFVTQHFSNDANGKMLLGMAFVLSKQYSDNLSQNVTRGVRNRFKEGKSPTYKHGYLSDENGLYRPDGKKFELIQEAWKKRISGTSLKEIADYLNTNGYGRVIKTSKRVVKITKQTLSDMFKDPFYYGIFIQANQQVNLREIYNFEAATTEDDYTRIQILSGRKVNPYKKRVTYYPLKMMINCSYCDSHMYAAASKSRSGGRYLYYRCDNKLCSRQKKSIRAKVIFDFIYVLLQKGLNFGNKEYKQYLKTMSSFSNTKQEETMREIHSKEASIKYLEREISDISYKVLSFDKDSIVRVSNEDKLQNLQNEKDELRADVARLRGQLGNPEQEIISFKQFLNLSKNAANTVQMGNAVVKDAICRLIFLNLTVDEEKVLSWQAKPPFDELLKTRPVVFGRG